MLYPTVKPSSADERYGDKDAEEQPIVNKGSSVTVRFHSLSIESQVFTPTLNWAYSGVDNKFRVSCVQWYGEQKSEGTPGHWDSYCFAETFAGSNPVGVAVLYFGGCALAGPGQAENRSTETKKAVGAWIRG
jgi:hypothetical protein